MRRRKFFRWLLAMPASLVVFLPRRAQAMTKTQMQALVTAVTNAGFPAELKLAADGVTWTVRSRATDFTVNVNAVKNLADAQGVGAFVAEVEYR